MVTSITGKQKLFGEVFCGNSYEQSSALLCLACLASTPSYIYGVPRGKGVSELIGALKIFSNVEIDGLGSAFVEPYEAPVDFKEYDLNLDQSIEKAFLIPLLVKRGITLNLTIDKSVLYLYKNCISLLSIVGLNILKKSEYRYVIKGPESRKIDERIKIDFLTFNFFESLFLLCIFATFYCRVTLGNFPKDPAVSEILESLNSFNSEKEIFKFSNDSNEALLNFTEGYSGFKANVKFNYEEAGFYSFLTAGLEGRLTIKNVSLSDIFPLRVRIGNWGLVEEQDENNNLKIWYESSHFKDSTNISIESKEFPGFILSWALCSVVYLLAKKIPFRCKFLNSPFIKDIVVDLNRMGADLEVENKDTFIILVSQAKGSLSGKKIIFGDRKTFLPILLAALIYKGKSSISNFELFSQYFPLVVENLKNVNLIS